MKNVTAIVIAAAVLLVAVGSASAQTERQLAEKHHEQAKAYFRVEAYEDAIEEWEKSYELYANPNRLFNLGRAHEELEEYEDALEYYRRYVEDDPDGQAVSEANARIRRLEREVEKMRAETQRRESLASAREHMSEGDHTSAIEHYRRAYEVSEDPAIVYEIAQAHRLAENDEQAISEYERYMELAPEGERAADALAHQQTLEEKLESEEASEASGGDEDTDVALRDGAPREDPEPSGGGWSGMRIGGVSSLGVSAVAAGAGVVFGLQARSAQSTIEDAEGAWSSDLDDEVERGEAAQRNLVIATVVSGAALAAGGALLYLDTQRDGSSSEAISVAPSLSDSSAGLVVGGRF